MTNRYVGNNWIINIEVVNGILIFYYQSSIGKISDLKSIKQRKNAHLVKSIPKVTAI
jgi:hypothetical protein